MRNCQVVYKESIAANEPFSSNVPFIILLFMKLSLSNRVTPELSQSENLWCNNHSRLNGGAIIRVGSIFKRLLPYGTIIFAHMFHVINLYMLGFTIDPINHSIVPDSHPAQSTSPNHCVNESLSIWTGCITFRPVRWRICIRQPSQSVRTISGFKRSMASAKSFPIS